MIKVLILIAATSAHCYPLPQAITDLEADKGVFIDLVDIPGENFDQLLFGKIDGLVKIWGVKKGCMVGRPLTLDISKDTGEPT